MPLHGLMGFFLVYRTSFLGQRSALASRKRTLRYDVLLCFS